MNAACVIAFKVILYNFRDPKDVVRPRIPFSSCLKSFGDTETVEDFFSSAIQSKTIAEK